MDALGVVLYGLPLVVLIICIAWFMIFMASSQKGERLTRKWTEVGRVHRVLIGLSIAGIFVNFYLAFGNWLALLGPVSLPFSSIYSIYGLALSWTTTLSILALVVIFWIRFPKRIIA